jgi:hypothetical protein
VKEIVASTNARVGDEAEPGSRPPDGILSEELSRMSFAYTDAAFAK